MEGHLEALLEMDFCTKPPNFGVEAHMEAPAGDALIGYKQTLSLFFLRKSLLFYDTNKHYHYFFSDKVAAKALSNHVTTCKNHLV
jgi:hypothetical protein